MVNFRYVFRYVLLGFPSVTECTKNPQYKRPGGSGKKYPFFGIFRNKNNNKWFALITNIDRSLIDKGNGEIELLNIKLDKDKINKLLEKEGFYKAYHMNKKSWISIILDKTLTNNEIFELINESYDIVNNSKKGIINN